ncbi:MAG: response regulator [Spirochaetaceae bacterium]|nr:MAG: response regulator [Spirochaetaceae bacterium]
MRVLVAEDDFGSRKLLQSILTEYGECDAAVDGEEAVQAFKLAWKEKRPYDLVCMDIMMPKVNGQEALKAIRDFERDTGVKPSQEVKVIMTTVLDDPKNVIDALYKGGASAYVVKPINKEKFLKEVKELGLL